jgi:branched-chain amino acid transport system substrate-binding protein
MTSVVSRRSAGAAAIAAAVLLAMPVAAQDTIKFGLITDKTGSARFYAEPVAEGVILGAKVINAKGGVLGKKIEILVEDDQNIVDVSATKARKLADAGVLFIFTNTASPATLAQQTVTKETKTLHITPANSADFLTQRIDNPWFWQMGPLASQQAATLLSFTKGRKYKKVALMTDNSELGQANAGSFRDTMKAAGLEIVADEVVQRGATTAVPQMQKVRAANPDAIFQAGILGPEMVLFFKAYHELGMKMPIHGSYNLSIPGYLAIAKDLMEGVTFIDAYDPDKPEVKAFIEVYKKEFGKVPFSLPAYGYDAINLAVDAIKRAGSFDREKIRAAMQGTKGWVGVIGAKGSSITFVDKRAGFDHNGAVVRVIENNNHGKVVHAGAK